LVQHRVLLITGPAGAGKSTVAKEWATSNTADSVHLSLDSFRELVKSGFRNPELGWVDETQRQLDLARSNVAAVAKNYTSAGFDIVVDDAVFPNWSEVGIDRWKEAMSPIEIRLIVLLPSWNKVFDRNASRSEDRRLRETTLHTIYDDMCGWREKSGAEIIDNSNLTVAQTVSEINRILKSQSS